MSKAIFEIMNLETDLRNYPFSCHLESEKEEGIYIGAHYHYEVELLFFYEGGASVIVGNKTYSLCKGEMMLINAMEVHSIIAEKDMRIKYITIMFNPSILKSKTDHFIENKYVMLFSIENSNIRRIFTKEQLDNTNIPNTFETVLVEYSEKRYGFEFAVSCGIMEIILWILRNCFENDAKSEESQLSLSSTQKDRFERVFDYVENNYSRNITSEEISNICFYDYAYFARQFKNITKKTFKEYLNFVRVTKAKRLLLTSDKSITDIAIETGFSNSSYFTKQYKKQFKVTPRQDRKISNEVLEKVMK
jgi:AraC family transcriptional regulator, melibiose operon regulatory protein